MDEMQPAIGQRADELTWLRERVTALAAEVQDNHQCIAILVRKLGGEVVISDEEIVAIEHHPRIEVYKSAERTGMVLRVIDN